MRQPSIVARLITKSNGNTTYPTDNINANVESIPKRELQALDRVRREEEKRRTETFIYTVKRGREHDDILA